MGVQNGAHEAEAFDILIIGAGISGINTAYRLQTQLPGATFAILEGRGDVGGTWDLFRYPGIRSDSDLFTFGFQWEPWPYETPIARGPLIRDYMKKCVAKYNLDRYIRFHHKVLSADWSKATEQWKIVAEHDGRTKEFKAPWVIFGTGYYDYENPAKTTIPGLDKFKGKIIHPQHWPEDYDHSGKKMIIIGSGATAVTLFPALSETAEAVTLVQRSPSFIVSARNGSPVGSWLMKILPAYYAGTWLRIALRDKPNSNILTGTIDTVTENGLRMKDGTFVEADAIVTATGLYMRMGGNIAITVNGQKMEWANRLVWNGSMLQDVPNLMFMIGYTNASWTLGADDTAHVLTRLLKYMDSRGMTTAVPRVPAHGTNGYQRFWQLTSTYSNEAEKRLPKYGNSGPSYHFCRFAASVVGLLAAGGKVTSLLFTVITKWRDSPALARSILFEVADISAALGQLQEYLSNRLQASAERGGLIMWMRQEDQLNTLVQRLQSHKSSLTLMLTIIQCHTMQEAQSSTQRLCILVEQVLASNQDLSERLRGLEREGSIINRAQSNIMPADDASTMRQSGIERQSIAEIRNTLVTRFAFDDDLKASRPYKKAVYRYSQASITSTALHTTALSVFSKLSLSQVSSISLYALPIWASDIHNSDVYVFGEAGAAFPHRRSAAVAQDCIYQATYNLDKTFLDPRSPPPTPLTAETREVVSRDMQSENSDKSL
ncbi:hypothetical protein NPX13_g9473 [Xylaria arbuscula]|uniref:FAD/NAD(P)-binding domain-containing protein n=1 Tax=Xylaria arbuscula TaxID=114810 RepID=A0A9W8N6M0_9PEZI|nr:hypothetical protein NPX13_g9473 [Xylaria arbuscula]